MIRKPLCAAALLALSQLCFAEDYVDAGYASIKSKDDQSGLKFSGSGFALNGRIDLQDLKAAPFFFTAGFQSASIKNTDLGITLTEDVKGYNLGTGYAWMPSEPSEVDFSVTYAHSDGDLSAPGFGSASATSDGVVVALGGHAWLNDTFKLYGEVGYDNFSHKTTGFEFNAGLEAEIAKSFRLFVEYDYSSDKTTSTSPSDTVKTDVIAGGLKIPFGGRR